MNKNDEFKILLVCTGNTCRSPMAEGMLRQLLGEEKIEGIEVSSAGTGGLTGYPATPFAIEAAKTRGLDISGHSSLKLTQQMLEQADLVLAMSQEHLESIRRLSKKSLGKCYLLKLFPEKNRKDGDFDIRDPVGGTLDDYNQCFLEIEQELSRVLPHIEDVSRKKEKS